MAQECCQLRRKRVVIFGWPAIFSARPFVELELSDEGSQDPDFPTFCKPLGKYFAISAPVIGLSWEGFVLENIFRTIDAHRRNLFYYRTSSGNEMDLIIENPGADPWSIEIKRNAAPRLTKALRLASQSIQSSHNFIVYPDAERYRLADDTEVISLPEMISTLSS